MEVEFLNSRFTEGPNRIHAGIFVDIAFGLQKGINVKVLRQTKTKGLLGFSPDPGWDQSIFTANNVLTAGMPGDNTLSER